MIEDGAVDAGPRRTATKSKLRFLDKFLADDDGIARTVGNGRKGIAWGPGCSRDRRTNRPVNLCQANRLVKSIDVAMGAVNIGPGIILCIPARNEGYAA